MGVVTRAKKRRLELEEEEQRHLTDWISRVPDDVLGDIVSLLPTKAGARTQVLSSRWRHIWRSAPLNLDGFFADRDINSILSSHHGPVRRFSYYYIYHNSITNVDHWLLVHPSLLQLQELQLHQVIVRVPESLQHFSSTLRVASFSSCSFPDGSNAYATLHLPLLKQLDLSETRISESSFHALLAACPGLQSLLLHCNDGFPRAKIVSPSLISIGVHRTVCAKIRLQLVIEDTPSLERLLFLGGTDNIDVSVISAPRLLILGKLSDNWIPKFQSSTTVVQGSNIASMTEAVSSVKVLALSSDVKLSLNVIINIIKCFPHLETLYIKMNNVGVKNWLRHRKIIGTLDIRLRKIVLANYQGYKSHVKLAKFFLSNARVLELMRFEVPFARVCDQWMEEERSLFQIEKRASMAARFEFVSENILIGSCSIRDVQVHDLSIPDPFQRNCRSV